jgi:hypothetical protein
MVPRASVGRAAGWMAVLLIGCGTRTALPPAEVAATPVAAEGRVKLHVKDMAKVLQLT